jgi:AraC-like DNA-binding protein
MFRRATLIRTPLVDIVRSDHAPGTLRHGTEEERELSHAITFVEAGEFGVGAGAHDWLLRERGLLISRPGAVYRYTHARNAVPDVCLTVRFASGFDDACERELSAAGIAPPATNHTAFLRWRLTALLDAGDAMAVDAWSAELLAALRDRRGDGDRLHRPSQLRWYAERVEAARATLERRYAEPHTLASLAASVAISPFQFARVFRQLTGRPPHQYLMQVRLDAARRMLLDRVSVTDACYDTGFSSLSHFIHVFKRRYGCTPSEARQAQEEG